MKAFWVLLLALVLGAASPTVGRADVVTDWNNVALDLIREAKTTPPEAARALAMAHIAMFDAANAIDPAYRHYVFTAKPTGDASIEAAVAKAAHQVLSQLYPDHSDRLDRELARSLAPVEASRLAEGKRIGEQAARAILEARANDGADARAVYTHGTKPGQWRPTPPDYKEAMLPQWIRVKPFAMRRPSQFRGANPPPLTSKEYANDFNEVKSLGGKDSVARTDEQTRIAWFWEDGAGTVTPPGHWNQIAQAVLPSDAPVVDSARLFALLNVALADAAIACWDTKFSCHLWRPVTAIHEADTDDNPATEADPNWMPLLPTPPFPSCASGHSTFSGAAATILARFFGSDDRNFEIGNDRDESKRSFASFTEAAEEAGRSRIYGGIHFEVDNRVGLEMGRQIGQYVFDNFLQEVADGPALAAADRPETRSAQRPAEARDPQLTFADPAQDEERTHETRAERESAKRAQPEEPQEAPQQASAQEWRSSDRPANELQAITSAPVTVYYPPEPVTGYYAPPVTSYYAPTTTYYAAPPATSYVAPTTTYYAPTTTYYGPTTTYYSAPTLPSTVTAYSVAAPTQVIAPPTIICPITP